MTWFKADAMVNAKYLVGSTIFLSALIVLVKTLGGGFAAAQNG